MHAYFKIELENLKQSFEHLNLYTSHMHNMSQHVHVHMHMHMHMHVSHAHAHAHGHAHACTCTHMRMCLFGEPPDRAGTFGILQPHHGSGVGTLQPITVRGRSWLVTHCSAKSLELWTSAAGDRRRNYCSQSVRATTRVLTDMTACDMTRKKQPRVR